MKVNKFKPNLIPNNPKDGTFTKEVRDAVINKNGGASNYIAMYKKDGCRMQLGLSDEIYTRSLKKPKSKLVNERFAKLNQFCIDNKIAVDGEFYMHGLKLNQIVRFFTKTDVTCPKYKAQLEKEQQKNPEAFDAKYEGMSIAALTHFHEALRFFPFDGIVLDRPDLTRYEDRIREIKERLKHYVGSECFPVIWSNLETIEDIDEMYDNALKNGWEGLVLTCKDHEYKFGRNSLKQGTILKLKDDAREYDGVVIDVKESTKVKEDAEKTVNELGRSVTSKKKDDRIPSGMAKSFVIQYDENHTLDVCLKGFSHDELANIWNNKDEYIGRHFKYTAMAPVKHVPRHAFFDCWRDEK